ncbi:MAG TPA: DUF2062 domain-containing protein [Thermoanaerobaculia bacterium]|nr:DUF2062 domain-containing protein [Thermoanaerobaculia bacterium]
MSIFSGRWQRFILHLMGKEDPPERIAAAFALGVAISFFTPLTGFHTLIALGLAFLLGLSKVDVVMGTFVVNPWTVVPVITFEEFLGKKILRLSPSLAPRLPWREILHKKFWHTLRGSGWNYLAALTVGSVVASALAATVTYFLVHGLILRYQRTHPHLAAQRRCSADTPIAPEEPPPPGPEPR